MSKVQQIRILLIYRKLLKNDTYVDVSDIGESNAESRLYQNYAYFYNCVKDLKIETTLDLINALERMIIVELDIENEDPQEIFESLNSTGLDLSDADLIRNYLLMSLDHETQKELYEKYWYRIEENVGPSNMVRFFLDYYIYTRKSDTMAIHGKKTHISTGHLYHAYKEYYKSLTDAGDNHCKSQESTKKLLKDMLRCSEFYKKLVFGNKIDMNKLSAMEKTIYSILYINEVVTSRPALMYIMEKYDDGVINEEQALEMLNACLSMVFRSKVTKSNNMSGQFVGNMLLRLSENDSSDYTERFWKAITAGRGDFAFPSDEEFSYSLLNGRIFDILRSKGTKYLLYTLEQNSESAKGLPRYDDQNITIEHIMPKTLSLEWIEYLGDSASKHSDFLNKLGNLTLTNNNSEMSNDLFNRKQKWYAESSFHYTRELTKIKEWSIEEICKRNERLVDLCINIWSIPKKYQQNENNVKIESKSRRLPFRFSMIGLSEGDEIQFIDGPSITVTIVDDSKVKYKGDHLSLSKLAAILKGTPEQSLQGPLYFMYDGKSLSDIRNEYESNVR